MFFTLGSDAGGRRRSNVVIQLRRIPTEPPGAQPAVAVLSEYAASVAITG